MDRFLNFPNLPTSLTSGSANISASSITVVGMSSNQPVRTGAGAFLTTGDIAISEVTGLQTTLDSKTAANGFPDTSELNVTFSEATPDRTVTLTPTATNFKVYIGGVTYTKTTETFQISTAIGVHMVYYNSSGVLAEIVNPSDTERHSLLKTYALVCVINWNNVGATGFKEIFFSGNNLLHGVQMNNNTQAYLYAHFGIRWILGGLLGDFSEDQDGSLADHARFSITAADLLDQDIYLSLGAILETTGMPIYHIISGAFFKQTNAGFSVATTGTGRLAYNPNWTSVAEVSDGYYVYAHIYATSNSSNAYYSVMSRYQYDTLATAQDAGPTEVCELNQTFPLFELTPIGSVLYQTDSTYTNAVKARVVSISATEIFHDTRRVKISQQVICLKHSQIAGLNDDDHKIYSLLSGRLGDELYIDQINEFTTAEGTIFPNVIKATGGILVNTIGESTISAGITFNHIPKTSIAPSGVNDICNKSYVDSVVSGNHWDRSGTTLSPIISGDDIRVDHIREQTTDNGVTIELVDIKDGNLNCQPIGAGSILLDAGGNAELHLSRALISDLSYVKFSTDGTAKWYAGLYTTSSDNYSINNNTSNALEIAFADNTVSILNTMKVDTINEYTADTGVTIEGVALENGSGIFKNIVTGSSLVQINANSAGNATLCLQREGTANNAVVKYESGASVYWSTGITDSSNSFYIWYDPDGTPAKSMQIADDGRIFFPASHGDQTSAGLSEAPLWIDSSGLIGLQSSTIESKTKITDITKEYKSIYDLKPKKFKYKKKHPKNRGEWIDEEDGYWNYGFIAEDVELVDNTLCFYKSWKDRKKPRNIQHNMFTALAIKCIQEQKKEIDELKEKLNIQGQRMAVIEKRLADLERI